MEEVGHSIARIIHRTGIWLGLGALVLLLVVVVILQRRSTEAEKVSSAWQAISEAQSSGSPEDLREALAGITDRSSVPWMVGATNLGWLYTRDPGREKLNLARGAFTKVVENSPPQSFWHDFGRFGQAWVALDAGQTTEADKLLDELRLDGQWFIKHWAESDTNRRGETQRLLKMFTEVDPETEKTGTPDITPIEGETDPRKKAPPTPAPDPGTPQKKGN